MLNVTKDCSSKFRSKHSSNTVMSLLRNLLEQSLPTISKPLQTILLGQGDSRKNTKNN